MEQTIIQFTIADRPYRLVVKPEERDTFDEAVRHIELQMKRYAENFAFQDKQDLLAMVALQYVSESLMLKKAEKQQKVDNFLAEKLLIIEETLDEVL
jgi:cell division protein ZapA (FtsZ GTPase activity inhibitor)